MARKSRDPKQAAWRTFLTAHALLMRRIEEALAASGVQPMEAYRVLEVLEESPAHRLRLSELADAVFLTRSGTTRLADRLEKGGLIRRMECPGDRRGAFAVLTDLGLSELERTRTVYNRAVAEHFGSLVSAGEAESLRAALGRVATEARASRSPRPDDHA